MRNIVVPIESSFLRPLAVAIFIGLFMSWLNAPENVLWASSRQETQQTKADDKKDSNSKSDGTANKGTIQQNGNGNTAVIGNNNKIINVLPPAPPPDPAKPPFSFAVEVGLTSPGVTDFVGMWVEAGSQQGCNLIPIDDLLFFRISNNQPIPKLLVNYAVEARVKGEWRSLKRVKVVYRTIISTIGSSEDKGENLRGGGILEFPSSGNKNMYPMIGISTGEGDLKKARVVNLPVFDFLIGGLTLAEGQSVRGWSAFQFAGMIDLNDLRMKVTDEIGKTYTVMPTIIKGGPDDDLTPHPIQIGPLVDVSNCTRGVDY